MIKRSLVAVVVLGGFCAIRAFADTIVGGLEDFEPNSSIEGYGDYNDMIFSMQAAGLQLVTLDGGTWSAFPPANINQDGSPFWDNLSLDTNNVNPGGVPKTIGFCLTTVSTTNNCGLPGTTPAVTQYLSIAGNPDNNFYFTFSGSAPTAVHLAAIAAMAAGESLSWYDPFDQSQHGTIFAAGSSNGTTVSFTPTSTFGLYFTVAATNSTFFTQNALDSGNGAGTSESRFAMFRIPVPEPGTMALFGIGALTLGLPWLRKRR